MSERRRSDPFWEAKFVTRLSETLLLAASEEIETARATPTCLLNALTLLLGRAAGRIARDETQDVDELSSFLVRHLNRVIRQEYARPSWPLN